MPERGEAVKTILLLDTETTGLDPIQHRCIEVGVILFDLDCAAPIASYANLIRSSSNEAEAVNRIPASILTEASEPEKTWRMVEAMATRADVIVAHRAEFDRSFVPPSLRAAKPWVCSKFHIEWPLGKTGDSLVTLALAHGVGVVSAHRALTDCDILSRLLTRVHDMGHPLPALFERAMRPRVKVVAHVTFDDREKAKAAGFAWDATSKTWWREMPQDELTSIPFPFHTVP